MRRVAEAGERAVFGLRECGCDRLAARLGRDDVFGAAGNQHLLPEPPGIVGERAVREAVRGLAVAVGPDAALAPAHQLERDRWRGRRHQCGRALFSHSFRTELVELLEPAGQLSVTFRGTEIAVPAGRS